MSAITKEFTKEQLQQIIETDHVQCGEASELARIALASLESEPVAWLYSASFERGHVEGELTDAPGCDMPVYTSPSAPVSVPEVVGWEDVPEEITEDDIALASAWAHGFNQFRAAMIQCADGSVAHEGKNHPEDKLGMVDHFGGSNNMVEPVTDNTNQQFESLSRDDK